MENSGPLILCLAVVLLFLVLTRIGRLLVVVGIALVALMTAKNVFVRDFACPRTDQACFEAVQKVNYGPCWASEGTGLLRIDGTYYLTARPGVNASATCISLAVWQ